MLKAILAWAAASLLAYLVASFFVTQFNIAALAALSQPTPLGLRISTTLQDVVGMSFLYLPLIAVGLGIAFLSVYWPLGNLLGTGPLVYIAAGFVALLTLHLAMILAVGLNPIAPTRELTGFFSQCFAGAMGGYLFHRLRHSENH